MKITSILSKQEIAQITQKSDLMGWRVFLWNWFSIFVVFASVAFYTNPVTMFVAIVLLGGRQLALSVLMHECGHRTLFKTPWLNEVIGQWCCALPVMNDLRSYAKGHLKHHQFAGTKEDPDLPNYQAYPVSRASFKRKIIRDVTGQTGAKLLLFIFRGAGDLVSREKRANAKPLYQGLLVQFVLWSILFLVGYGWLYLLWVAAFLTSYMLLVRLRQVAEHAAVPDLFDLDPRLNTRTTQARWWERWLLAPNYVNFHMEHHFMASVPCYRLPELHALLQQKGVLNGVPEFHGYGEVMHHVVQH